MLISEASFPDIKGRIKEPIGTSMAPIGWWVYGTREEIYQSWERPFMLSLVAVQNSDMSGARIVVDTGEAFSWHDAASMSSQLPGFDDMFSPSPLSGFLGAQLGLPASMFDMPAIPDFKVPTPHTGREDRQFTSVSDYLRDIAHMSSQAPDGTYPQLSLVKETIVGETEADALAREQGMFEEQRPTWETMGRRIGGGNEYRLLSILDRTVMQEWVCHLPDGSRKRLFIGAMMSGRETSCYGPGKIPQGRMSPQPFGQTPLGGALYHEVMWMAWRRFCGLCDDGAIDARELEQAVIQMGMRARFSDALMDEMEEQRKQLSASDLETQHRETEELRQLGREMREESRNRDMVREWEDARRRERQQASEQRIRDGWSAVIRGVDRYVGPGGRMIEFPVEGIGYRAYYDPLSHTVMHTDRPPYGWEELPRWS